MGLLKGKQCLKLEVGKGDSMLKNVETCPKYCAFLKQLSTNEDSIFTFA